MGKTRRRVSPRLAKSSVSERRCYVKYAKKIHAQLFAIADNVDTRSRVKRLSPIVPLVPSRPQAIEDNIDDNRFTLSIGGVEFGVGQCPSVNKIAKLVQVHLAEWLVKASSHQLSICNRTLGL